MEIGKVPENVLKRSVFKKLRVKRPEVLVHSGIGEDCSALVLEDEAVVLSTDPITGTAKDIGRLAFHITANDIASSGAELVGMQNWQSGTMWRSWEDIQKYLLLSARRWYLSLVSGRSQKTG